MARKRSRAERFALAVAATLLPGLAALAVPATEAQPRGGGYAWDDPEWRFTLRQRRVKVVLLAGSIGAFQDEPYPRLLHEWCANAEIRNLSRVGFGAWQLYERLREEVLRNDRVPFGAEGIDLWLLWNGGLNSLAASQRTNHYIRRAFRDAHRRGMRVVGLTVTPWGSFEDERRWGGVRALETLRNTRRIVDFVMGRIGPREALGRYAEDREVPANDPWTPEELADVRVDLFDSPLRDRDARPRDVGQMRALIERDARWRRLVAPLDPSARQARLWADAQTLATIGQWFLRPDLRGFDSVHPNRAGHRLIAEFVCPRLPPSWGCACPSSAAHEARP